MFDWLFQSPYLFACDGSRKQSLGSTLRFWVAGSCCAKAFHEYDVCCPWWCALDLSALSYLGSLHAQVHLLSASCSIFINGYLVNGFRDFGDSNIDIWNGAGYDLVAQTNGLGHVQTRAWYIDYWCLSWTVWSFVNRMLRDYSSVLENGQGIDAIFHRFFVLDYYDTPSLSDERCQTFMVYWYNVVKTILVHSDGMWHDSNDLVESGCSRERFEAQFICNLLNFVFTGTDQVELR